MEATSHAVPKVQEWQRRDLQAKRIEVAKRKAEVEASEAFAAVGQWSD